MENIFCFYPNTLKMFLGQQTDKYRAPYERREEEHVRSVAGAEEGGSQLVRVH